MLKKSSVLLLLTILFFSLYLLKAAEVSSEEEENITIEETNINPSSTTSYYDKQDIYPKAPNFYAHRTNGYGVSLNAFTGNIVMLSFWATYDRYCQKSVPIFNDIQDKYSKKDVKVVVVGIDSSENIKEFLKNNQPINYTLLIGSKNLASQYNVWGLPTIYLLDKNLCIRKIFSGYTDKKTLEKEIRKLM